MFLAEQAERDAMKHKLEEHIAACIERGSLMKEHETKKRELVQGFQQTIAELRSKVEADEKIAFTLEKTNDEAEKRGERKRVGSFSFVHQPPLTLHSVPEWEGGGRGPLECFLHVIALRKKILVGLGKI